MDDVLSSEMMVSAVEDVKAMPHAMDVSLRHGGAVVLQPCLVNAAIIDTTSEEPPACSGFDLPSGGGCSPVFFGILVYAMPWLGSWMR